MADSIDLTKLIKPGKMTFRFICGIGLDDFTFILSASLPSSEERRAADMRAERERDMNALMMKLQAISVPPGGSFKFPLAAPSA